jgi:hypothetical protein
MSMNIMPTNTTASPDLFNILADGAKHSAAALNMLVDSITLASAAERARASVLNTARRALSAVRNAFSTVRVVFNVLRNVFHVVRNVFHELRNVFREVRNAFSEGRVAYARLRTF